METVYLDDCFCKSYTTKMEVRIDDFEFDEEAQVNMMTAENLARDSKKRREREQEDPDYAYEMRCIDYLERSDDDYMY